MLNLTQLIEKNVKLFPDQLGIIFKDHLYTYEKFYNKVKILCSELNKLGICRGSHVAIFLNNGIEFSILMLSCAKLGATIVPLPLTIKGVQRKKAIQSSKVEYVIGWHYTIKDLISDELISSEKAITIGGVLDNVLSFEKLIEGGDSSFEPPYEVLPSLNYILTMTSGSTGDPKPIIFTHQAKINRAIEGTAKFYGLGSKDVILLSTPMYHSLAQRSLLLPLLIGGTCVILEKFTPELWCEAVEKHKVTFLFAVSNQLEMLIKFIKTSERKYNLTSLRTIISSSAVLKTEVKSELLQIFDCDIHECYGTSEVGVVTNYSIRKDAHKLGSVGKPLPYVDLVIRSPNGEAVKPGDPGEITCKTLTLFGGYYGNQEATSKAVDNNGYFYTGDLGKVDEDGYLYYLDRLKDVIKTGGISVYSRDIETIIKMHHEVLHCAVIGIPDERLGEVVIAVIVPKNKDHFDLKEVKKLCFENLIDYQMPRAFEVVDSIPMTGLGKIQKGELKKKFDNYKIKSFI